MNAKDLSMISPLRVSSLVLALFMLAGCQSTSQRNAELAQICSDPANRAPGQFYYDECLALYPKTPQQLQQDYLLTQPAGDE
jgi:hypothetical protein